MKKHIHQQIEICNPAIVPLVTVIVKVKFVDFTVFENWNRRKARILVSHGNAQVRWKILKKFCGKFILDKSYQNRSGFVEDMTKTFWLTCYWDTV